MVQDFSHQQYATSPENIKQISKSWRETLFFSQRSSALSSVLKSARCLSCLKNKNNLAKVTHSSYTPQSLTVRPWSPHVKIVVGRRYTFPIGFRSLFWGKLAVKLQGGTWRIIPFSKWLVIIMVSKSPRPGVVGPLPNGPFMAYKWGVIRSPLTFRPGSPSSNKIAINHYNGEEPIL